MGTTYAEGMDAQTRAGAVSIGYSIGTVIFAAPTLYVMTLINTTVAASWAPGLYMAAYSDANQPASPMHSSR